MGLLNGVRSLVLIVRREVELGAAAVVVAGGAALAGGTWRGTNVGGAQFASASIEGPLRCANCTFGSVRYPGVVTLAAGQWAPL